MTIPEGTAIGSILVGEPLYSGDDGDVYLGRQPGVGRPVAIRVLRRGLLHETGRVERFRREASLGGRVTHPNLVQVFDYFSFRDDHYLVTEFVEGTDLGRILERTSRVPARIAARIVLECARGLDELHARGIVHGALRPGHVLLSRWGEVKLKGLGGGRELSEAAPAVAPASHPYGSPEFNRGRRIDARSDVYSLGALLLELVTGRLPGADAGVATRGPRLVRLARRCLRESASERPPLERVLARLERSVGEAGPLASRIEIAAWLWQERLLERRADLLDDAGAPGAAGTPRSAPGLAAVVTTPDPARKPEPAPGSLRPPLLPQPEPAPEPDLPTAAKPKPLEKARPGPRPPARPEAVAREPAPKPPAAARHRPDPQAPGRTPRRAPRRTPRRTPGGTSGRPIWIAAGATTVLLLLVGGSFAVRRTLDAPAADAETPAVAAAPAPTTEPGSLVVAVDPWAHVEIDGEHRFTTPRAAPLELPAGEHVIVFRHPALGEARETIDLASGESRILRHRFPEPAP